MNIINEEFSYYISPDKNTEALIGLKQYFEMYIKESRKNIFDGNIPETSKFISSNIIGTLMFELLQNDNIEYDAKTKSNIEYFKFYLNKCIEDKNYCHNKIFLSCIQECLSLHLPQSFYNIEKIYTIEQIKDYNVIHSNKKQKTNIIYKNINEIGFSKIYFCKNIEDLFICSLYELFEKGYIIRKCQNCKRFFVTREKGNRIKYCYNTSPQNSNKTCYEFFSQATYTEKRRESLMRKEYGKLYSRYNNRYQRALDSKKATEEKKELLKNELEDFIKIYSTMRKYVNSGKLTENEVALDLINYENGGKEKWLFRK